MVTTNSYPLILTADDCEAIEEVVTMVVQSTEFRRRLFKHLSETCPATNLHKRLAEIKECIMDSEYAGDVLNQGTWFVYLSMKKLREAMNS
jgi:hypothetical protein